MEINHFSHEHSLVLSEENWNHEYCCNACGSRIVGLSYCCEECRYVLHKWCADLPCELTYHELHPDHPLLLEFSNNDYKEEKDKEDDFYMGIPVCKSCKQLIYREPLYGCTQCLFNLHADCASLPKQIILEIDNPNSSSVGTKLCLTFKHTSVYNWGYKCNFCNDSGNGSRFITIIEGHVPEEIDCHSWHIQCAMLAHKVKHGRHLHDLTLHPPIEKDLNYDECYCDACEQDRDPKAWVYYCESCEFAAHIGCGIAGLDRPKQLILSTHSVYKDPERVLKVEEGSKELSTSPKFEYYKKMEEERKKERILEYGKRAEELKHFLHEHSLILYDEKWNTTVECHACSDPIFGKTYICVDCKFYLHEWCAELPREIHHRLHSKHPLTLIPKEDFECKYCRKFSTLPYSFCCEECHFDLHIACAIFPENPIHHESHEHRLTPADHATLYDLPTCNACQFFCVGPMVRCDSCDFSLHLVCALYPPTGKAKTHMHSLSLTYSFQEDPNALEFICDACEKSRTPGCWLYSCLDPKCYFVAHVDCTVPKLFQNFICQNMTSFTS